MSKRNRMHPDDPEPAQPQPPAEDRESWNSAGFRLKVLFNLAFVALPAIVMSALGEHGIAAAWFGVGILVVIWQFWDQVRSFLRSFRSDRQDGSDE